MNRNSSNRRGVLFVILSAIFWAGSGVAGQLLTQKQGFNVFALTIYRLFASGLVLFLIASLQGIRKKQIDRVWAIWKEKTDVLRTLFLAVCGIGIMQFGYFMAIDASNAATATFLQYISPAFVVVSMAVLHKKKPRGLEIISVILAIIGVFLIATHGQIHSLALSPTAIIWSLLSAAAYTVYTIYPGKLFEKYGKINILAWAMSSVGIAGLLKAVELNSGFVWNTYTVLYFGYIVIFGTVIPFLLYSSGVEFIGAAKTNTLATLEPLVSAILIFFIMGTRFSIYDYMGAVCILAVTFLLAYGK